MRFDVHRAIMCQSPFFESLMQKLTQIRKVKPNKSTLEEKTEFTTTLKIDLFKAFSNRGFVLSPFQHIVTRRWESPIELSPCSTRKSNNRSNEPLNHILTSHIRFAIQWLYSHDKSEMTQKLEDEDTLHILSIAILFDIDDLADECIKRYTTTQLSLATAVRDLETIGQLPRNHNAYLQLRDAVLLLLLRYGPEHPAGLAILPVDYMADVLSADILFVGSEFERYCLLKKTLVTFMQSVGKITWTASGPVDQHNKRLSGFVQPPKSLLAQKKHQRIKAFGNFPNEELSANTVRALKRKRIPSEELEDAQFSVGFNEVTKLQPVRISFSACVPFEKLMADVSSGGVIDKATVLSYLLRTTVIYSNMTFDQLTTVRHDKIVNEEIVFRALWQREALERIIFPFHFQSSQPIPSEEDYNGKDPTQDRSEALNEYFDVDDTVDQERRRRILLGTPKFRFRKSIHLTPATVANGWKLIEKSNANSTNDKAPTETTHNDANESEDELENLLNSLEDEEDSFYESDQIVRCETSKDTSSDSVAVLTQTPLEGTDPLLANQYSPASYSKTFYSRPEKILGSSYSVAVEAQVMPRHLLYMNNTNNKKEGSNDEENPSDKNVLVCRFELYHDDKGLLRRELSEISSDKSDEIVNVEEAEEENNTPGLSDNEQILENEEERSEFIRYSLGTSKTSPKKALFSRRESSNVSRSSSYSMKRKYTFGSRYDSPIKRIAGNLHQRSQRANIRYSIYCLNTHENLTENQRVDQEDRVLVPVTESAELLQHNDSESGYVGQTIIHADMSEGVTIDLTVALEVFGFENV
ncbi:hypothetical protein PHYBLDRAFT_150035 [Phycomyces blakesleeanus NRRL 1555(-)]|uniref:BTB domain-containing protein n=1 Tax=Phycomyces blakesleeanus (strain ATCC 8743b / DSM 1359 / FGSC 10004 / NBRC 33097 / NRRL 1555) TaxID=763407 RepID=A0A162WMC5_PHYB8|nr:hypothetical protein PHYBLDRAFT_150035 [Phycomyces blakesleeanus NRRL 1555(-)]OAD69035.1 hypothetical protein PHYBLDRAFT_150035 [Phycomyces blakesleeanus NRRL 1555(-)]|eukprot:XP_018287075.1 hypothetical protein PHYBLDRAFT_150035 [Phycomyces blakesleeanus NRRL 1555(-)]